MSFVKGWRFTCVTAPFFYFCAALKQTRANAAAETRAALSRSSLLCFSSRDIFHIWVKQCCVWVLGFCHSRAHSAALPLLTSQSTPDWPFGARIRCKGFRLELQSRWICVKSHLPCFFLNPELVFLKQAEQSRAQMILYWKGCNAVYSVWTVLMFFRLLRFEKHLCHRPLDAGATCYQLRELMLLWLTAIWYNNERTSSPQKICWCVYILNLMVLTQAGKFVCSFLH